MPAPLLSTVLVINVPLAMLYIHACYFIIFEWYLLYTLTLSSPLTPPNAFDLALPTNNSFNLPLNLSFPLIANVSQRPPKDPYYLRPKGSPTYTAFTTYGESIPPDAIYDIYTKVDNALRAHLPQDQHVSMGFGERKYTGLGAKLTLETGFLGDMTWGQWQNASGTFRELYRRFGGFEFEFDIFSQPRQFLASGGMTLTD